MRVKHFSEHLEKSLDRVVVNLPAKTESILPGPDLERERVKEALLRIVEEEKVTPEPEEKLAEETPVAPVYSPKEEISSDVEKKVESLVDVAMTEGIPAALKLAKKQDVFIQDALHDALIDELLPELKKRGHL